MARLPRAVQAAIAEADRLQQQLAESANPPNDAEAVTPSQAEPSQEASPTAETPQPAPQQTTVDTATLEQQYRTLQGMMAAQAEELKQARAQAAQVAELQEQIRVLTEKLSEYAQQPTASQAPAPDTKTSAEDIEAFGDELVAMVERRALAAVQPFVSAQISRLAQRLDALEKTAQTTAQSVEATAADLFWGKLEQLVPDFREIDATDAWRAWLAEEQPLTGRSRQEFLNEAVRSADATRVAAFFEAFKSGQQVQASPKPAPSQASPALEAHVTPVSPVASQPPRAGGQGQKPVYTAAQLQEMSNRIIRLRNTRPAEAKAMEAEMDAAIAEGRVVP